MARPLKDSLDYFPLDIDFDQDDKLVVVIGKYGMQGLGVVVKIMGEVYRNGYFYPWTEREHYVFSNRVNVDINLTKKIVNECIKWGFFNPKVYESHNVLTSKGFQKRFIEAAKRRKSIMIREDYLLIDPSEECKNVSHSISIINANGNIVNVYINPDKCNSKSAETPQSKVKESKEKEKEEKNEELCPKQPPAIQDQPQISIDSSSQTQSKPSKKRPEYPKDSRYYKMAEYYKTKVDDMATACGLTHLTSRTNLQKWADDFRKLVEIDNHSDSELIKSVMDWVVTNEFWRSNVLSAETFRKHFTKLAIESKKPVRGTKGTVSSKPKVQIVDKAEGSQVSAEEHAELIKMAQKMQAAQREGAAKHGQPVAQ